MNALQVMKMQLNKTFTENGDFAYKSTGSACLDFFSLCGGMRRNISALDKLFAKAYAENPVIAIKILFYMRNIRGGLGERNSFRVLLKELAKFYPEVAKQIVYAVPEYGRWDDILVLLDTPVKNEAIALIKQQVQEDKNAMENGGQVSLLGKWLPSINTSSKKYSVYSTKFPSEISAYFFSLISIACDIAFRRAVAALFSSPVACNSINARNSSCFA
jgi:hypothetical protein